MAKLFGKSGEPRRNRTYNPQIKRFAHGVHPSPPCLFVRKFSHFCPPTSQISPRFHCCGSTLRQYGEPPKTRVEHRSLRAWKRSHAAPGASTGTAEGERSPGGPIVALTAAPRVGAAPGTRDQMTAADPMTDGYCRDVRGRDDLLTSPARRQSRPSCTPAARRRGRDDERDSRRRLRTCQNLTSRIAARPEARSRRTTARKTAHAAPGATNATGGRGEIPARRSSRVAVPWRFVRGRADLLRRESPRDEVAAQAGVEECFAIVRSCCPRYKATTSSTGAVATPGV